MGFGGTLGLLFIKVRDQLQAAKRARTETPLAQAKTRTPRLLP